MIRMCLYLSEDRKQKLQDIAKKEEMSRKVQDVEEYKVLIKDKISIGLGVFMGFIDENGYPLINEEQKIRIALSNRARLTMAEDMDVFGTPKAATFVNTVFANYKSEAKSSISLYSSKVSLRESSGILQLLFGVN